MTVTGVPGHIVGDIFCILLILCACGMLEKMLELQKKIHKMLKNHKCIFRLQKKTLFVPRRGNLEYLLKYHFTEGAVAAEASGLKPMDT